MANNKYFDYLSPRQSYSDSEISDRLGALEEKFGMRPTSPLSTFFAGRTSQEEPKKKEGLTGLAKRLRKLGNVAVEDIKETDKNITQSAPDYARFLAGQISRGERSPLEASDEFVNFGLAYDVPDAFNIATQLGSMAPGTKPTASVEKYRPFQQFAARQLGLNRSEEDMKSIEQAALSLGKTSPEEFSQFLGQAMLSSPEYIRKTPLAFAANLPYGGRYGVGYQTPEGTFTGTYRFKPTSSVDYS
jgi:hypothetical protein